jgi:hypothetical protein
MRPIVINPLLQPLFSWTHWVIWSDLADYQMVSWLSLKTKVEPRWRRRWVMSGDWWEATPSSRGLQQFTTKPLGYSVEPKDQGQGRRLDVEVRPPRPVQPPKRGGQATWAWSNCPRGEVWPPGSQSLRSFEAEDTRHDCKSCIGPTQACGGCTSVRCCWTEDFQNYPWGACIPSYFARVV